ncbi:PAS domain-containing protein [Phaeobacter italicus]|uniref:PAS domain-containing protein n=1 Tax=Phaeobacter italicus TaxID=481446 RepID=UPI001ADC894A|nr:PAS domain-containing protein [Phaeobacter italicus]MBO9443979.1 PAS domain-containing protein [Phaeobacter italicus]MBY5978109.1 PAS domain-containing protein [Phaeobacter italicus]MCI5099136.1 PAS domain-containing protein [Phaeobacter italicus]
MSFVDRRIESRPSRGEAPFALNEVFFSRTDSRGVIVTGNYVFRRVAHYEWDELLGAPHKIIRHQDMPKGVFQVFWDTIKSGKTIGAYVKNKSKDGLYYWVYAVVVPCGDGYLSARIKPTSAVFDTVRKVYADLLSAEQNEDLSPEESAERLTQMIQDLGFDDYTQFSTHALSEELLSRDIGLKNEPDRKIAGLRKMQENAKTLVKETEGLIRDFDAMHTIPHNLRVIASRIEPAGGPVTVLSQNYGSMSRAMSDWFEAHVMGKDSNFAVIEAAVNTSLFVDCMARILKECDIQLQKERRGLGEIDMESERQVLADLVKQQLDGARKGLDQVDREAMRITNACQVMHRHFLGLSSTRVLCKIESARLPESGDTLADIIDQLGVFQERISHRLEKIAKLSTEIRALEH